LENSIKETINIMPDGNGWLVITRPDAESQYIDIPSAEIAGVVERFLAIGEAPEKFKAFLSAAVAVVQK
jgi:hypothetical protein